MFDRYREELEKIPIEFKDWKKDKLIDVILLGMQEMGEKLINRINKTHHSNSNFSPIVLFVCNHISLLSGSNQIENDGITNIVLERLKEDISKARQVERSLTQAIKNITKAQNSIPTKTVTEVCSQKETINSLGKIIDELELIKDEQISIRYGCEYQHEKQFYFIDVFVGRVLDDLLELGIEPVKGGFWDDLSPPIVRYMDSILKAIGAEFEGQQVYSSLNAIHAYYNGKIQSRPNFYFGGEKKTCPKNKDKSISPSEYTIKDQLYKKFVST